jgi:hypothetical protein
MIPMASASSQRYDVEKGWEIATSLAGFYGNKPILSKIFVVTRN